MSLIQKLRVKRLNRLIRKLSDVNQTKKEIDNIPESKPGLEANNMIAWDKITKISETLNDSRWEFDLYTDTTKLLPGFIVYIVGKRAPTKETPYVTYKPEPRVIVSIHDSGVNGGTMFFTYSHNVERAPVFAKGNQEFQITSEEDTIYSPLTHGHAEYICKLLNLQSKRLYEKQLLKISNQQNQK